MKACRVLLTLSCALLGSSTPVFAARITFSCGSVGNELAVCRSGAEAWARKTGNEVEVLASPSSAGERLGQLQLLLAAKSPDIDVFLIDATWPGMLAEFFTDLKSDPRLRASLTDYFTIFIRNNTIKSKLIALPWFIDAGVLYYRKDLLQKYDEKPPETWTELTRIARKIQTAERAAGNVRLWGYVFEARAYEGLTCNGLEWIHSWGGGDIVDSSGKVTVNNEKAAQALELASSWIGTISPRGVLNYIEEEARGVFQAGNAIFLRNWPYVWKLANAPDSPVRGRIGMTFLPGRSGALGGWSLAVSKYSRHPREAIDLVLYLASAQEQKRRMILLGQNPSIPSLYRDPELLRKAPELPFLKEVFEHALPRPSGVTGPAYNRVSSEFWDTLHQILSGSAGVHEALGKLQERLEFLSRGGKW